MASTYSTNLKLELIGTGEQSGVWGTTTNTNFGTAMEQAVVGKGSPVFSSDADLTIALSNSNAAQTARAFVLNVTSGVSLTTTRNLIVPTIEKPYVVMNNTTGAQSIIVKTSSGSGITVPNGAKVFLYVDGTNVIQMLTKDSVGLSNVDNTSDATKNAATATLTNKTLTSPVINSPTGIVKADVGLSNVDNTSDANKPVSTATQTALDLKLNATNPSYTGTLTGGTGVVNLGSGQFVKDASGNVGIGTASPGAKLEVSGTQNGQLAKFGATTTERALQINQYAVGGFSETGYEFSSPGASGVAELSFATAGARRATLDSSGNLGLGVTPSAWNGYGRVLEILGAGSFVGSAGGAGFESGTSCYYAGGSWQYALTGVQATRYRQLLGAHEWFTAPSGTAGNPISFTQAMTLDASGNLQISSGGSTAPYLRFHNTGGNSGARVAASLNHISAANINYPFITANIVAGFDNSYDIRFFTDNGTSVAQERARIDSSGNLGIGTASPAAKLDVRGSKVIIEDVGPSQGKLQFGTTDETHFVAAGNDYLGMVISSVGPGNDDGIKFVTGTSGSGSETARITAAGNLGLGVTPSAWGGNVALEMQAGAALFGFSEATNVLQNAYYNGSNWIYKSNGGAALAQTGRDAHRWFTAPSGTAGNPISFTQAMSLNANGTLAVTPSVTQASVFNHPSGAYSTWQYGGTSVGDIGTANQTISGGLSGTDFGIVSRSGNLILGANGNTATLNPSGNLGLGVTPSAWGASGSVYKVLQYGISGFLAGRTGSEVLQLGSNAYNDGTDWRYTISGNTASFYQQAGGTHSWHTAPSGTAGNPISFTQAMTLDANGNLGLGVNSQPNIRMTLFGSSTTSATYSLVCHNSSGFAGFSVRDDRRVAMGVNEAVIVDTSGNLGLGVTPSAWDTGWKAFELNAGSVACNSANELDTAQNARFLGGTGWTYKTTAGASLFRQGSGAYAWYTAPSGTAGNPISFTQAMTLDASGNLIIGNSGIEYGSGIKNLVLEGSGGAAFVASYNAGAVRSVFYADSIGSGIGTNTSHPLMLRTGGAERARIDSSGNLLVGTTDSNLYGATDGAIVSVNNGARYAAIFGADNTASRTVVSFQNPNGVVGGIECSGTSTTYATSSDARLKENISDANNGSALIDSLQVRQFDWKADGSHQRYGFVAQELDTVYPEAVSKPADPEEMMGVDYSKLVPLLVQEIQALRARVAALEAV